MKRRHRYALNLFSFALLLFALYLNFVKKEVAEVSVPVIEIQSEASQLKPTTNTVSGVPSLKSIALK